MVFKVRDTVVDSPQLVEVQCEEGAQVLEEDIGNLLILVESTPAEVEGVVEVDEVAIGEDTRIIVIIKVLLLRFMLLNKQFNSWQNGLVMCI